MTRRHSPAYSRVEELIAHRRCVILDGGISTELEHLDTNGYELRDDALWGTWALINAPDAVADVHRRYASVGCDVISTDTWGLQGAMNGDGLRAGMPQADWMQMARRAIRLARGAVEDTGRSGHAAVAFSLHGDVADEDGIERFELLQRVFEDEPPDLVLLETMSLIQPSAFAAVQAVIDCGLPVWVSFRRCRHGLCGVFGEHWGGPEGDLFGRAARKLEDMGVAALLINCIPPDHVAGMVPWLRDFTDLPLGVYPNLGYYSESGWSFDRAIGGEEYAQMALGWRAEGADIIGGCCGVRPHHVEAAKKALEGTPPGRRRSSGFELAGEVSARVEPSRPAPQPWTDDAGRRLYPLPMPELMVEPGVFVPTPGSFLIWKHLFQNGIGKDASCLDVGCGTGLLTAQLALNGAAHVHAIDIDPRAAANTMSNAFRNGVADRVSAETVDLYPWEPDDSYDVIVASLYQMPNDPSERLTTHRPLDYWGRALFDHLIGLLPRLMGDDGTAYLMQLSILSQRETNAQLERHGLQARVADFAFFEFSELFEQHADQIKRVEELSDAYHHSFGDSPQMVAYLLEVTAT